MTQSERLKKVINSLLESPKSFSDGIGLPSATTIYDILSGKREIKPSVLKRIIDTYPSLNPEWLLNGEGEMFTFQNPKNDTGVLNEEITEYGCKLCKEKERYIKSLEDRVEAQKKVIESQEKCIETLRNLGGGTQKTASG